MLDLSYILQILSQKRPIFHSEADFQFALAWEIKQALPDCQIRLEFPPPSDPSKSIDILVRYGEFVYPIELKYKSTLLSITSSAESFILKNHGAQDLGCYDFLKDLCRVESLACSLDNFKAGFAIWLTNDPFYWQEPRNPSVGYAEFSVHDDAVKSGVMRWAQHLGSGTIKNREEALVLNGEYKIKWSTYSDLDVPNGLFKYVLLTINS